MARARAGGKSGARASSRTSATAAAGTKKTKRGIHPRPSRSAPGGGRDEVTRRRIIRAAAEIYREQGYERAGMVDIARRLGMTAPALYWYFSSKEEILVAFLEHTIAELIKFVRSLMRSSEPRQRLWEFMHAYVLWQLQQTELSAAYERIYAIGHLRNSLPEKQRQRITSLEREFYGICRDLVAEINGKRLKGSEVAPVAFALIGMVEHLITWFRPHGPLSLEQLATLYADITLAMVSGVSANRISGERKSGARAAPGPRSVAFKAIR